MKKVLTYFFLCCLCFTSCDSGDIIEKKSPLASSGLVIKFTGNFYGLNSWGEDYEVVLACFDDTDPFSIAQRNVLPPKEERETKEIVLTNIQNNATRAEVCVVNSLRERVLTLKELPIPTEKHAIKGDTLFWHVDSIQVGLFANIEEAVFKSRCTICHGENGKFAAGMSLLQGQAYASLVNHKATTSPVTRVLPFNASESYLLQVVEDSIKHTKFDHRALLNNEKDQKFFKVIRHWINSGAKP